VGARTGIGAARFAGGRFGFALRAGRSLGAGTMMVGSAVDGVVPAGARALWAHTLHGTSNAATPTHTRRMNFPAEFMAEAREIWRSQDPAFAA
jgi:hypothetical protein